MTINYLGKVNIENMFNCQMCRERSKDKYIAKPDLPSLASWTSLMLCKRCARREIGSKNKKKWELIHEKGKSVGSK